MQLKIYRANEEELLNGCRKRNRSAQKELYETYSRKMYTLCYRYVHDAMEAEDILVTSFTKVFEKIDQFKGEGSFEGWIKRIVINESLAFLRKNKAMYLEIDLEHADRELNYDQLSDHLEVEELLGMIRELPSGYRAVFNMYAIDGYTHKEIADHLGISENTSKSQLSRARLYLQKMLSQYNGVSLQKASNDETTT